VARSDGLAGQLYRQQHRCGSHQPKHYLRGRMHERSNVRWLLRRALRPALGGWWPHMARCSPVQPVSHTSWQRCCDSVAPAGPAAGWDTTDASL
jgi:hypothetical protein